VSLFWIDPQRGCPGGDRARAQDAWGRAEGFPGCPVRHGLHGGEPAGAGAAKLAEAVVAACEKPSNFKFLYPLEWTIKQKIEHIAKTIYGADGVAYDPLAEEQIARYEQAGFGNLPICMAKTHLSLSHDPSLKGVPTGYLLPVREVRASVGAGFIYPLIGAMSTMPGLATHAAFMDIDVDIETGRITGLF
jgi:methylenetetrahydrofolate dehydrogenase (NADP+)/methenyltetrahydrofolate cyclohydrolase/formyltetrahydrofolate synthetase